MGNLACCTSKNSTRKRLERLDEQRPIVDPLQPLIKEEYQPVDDDISKGPPKAILDSHESFEEDYRPELEKVTDSLESTAVREDELLAVDISKGPDKDLPEPSLELLINTARTVSITSAASVRKIHKEDSLHTVHNISRRPDTGETDVLLQSRTKDKHLKPNKIDAEGNTGWKDGIRLVELGRLAESLEACAFCKKPLFLSDIVRENRIGLGSTLYINCRRCNNENRVPTVDEDPTHCFVVNTKLAAAMLKAGFGELQMNIILAALNLPTIHHNIFKESELEIGITVKSVAETSCNQKISAVAPTKSLNVYRSEEKVKREVSTDGAYQTSGNGQSHDDLSVKSELMVKPCSSDVDLENAVLDDDVMQILLDDEPGKENGICEEYSTGVTRTSSTTSTCFQVDDDTCKRLEMSSENIVLVFAAVTTYNKKRPTLVCLTRAECTELPEEFEGFRVLQKPFYPSSKESLEAENSVDISSRGRKYSRFVKKIKHINETIAFHADNLLQKHTNLEAIRLSLVCATRHGFQKRPCIVLLCRCKSYIPVGEPEFPTELRHPKQNITFRTDIREGYFTLCVNGNDLTEDTNKWSKELAMGCSIGPENDGYSASIGPFVNIKETDETCFLTVRHVFQPLDKPSDQIVGTNVVQPADGDLIASPNQSGQTQMQNRHCGKVKVAQMNDEIDASLVSICSERIPSRGNFVGVKNKDLEFAGLSKHQYPVYDDGSSKHATEFTANDYAHDRIIKFGKETGLSKGTLRISNMAVRVVTEIGTIQHGSVKQRHKLKGQLQVDSYARKTFCQEGDSGSAVFLVDRKHKLHCIGMVVGVTSDLTCVVTPIQPILEGLGIKINKTLELKRFVHEDMDIST